MSHTNLILTQKIDHALIQDLDGHQIIRGQITGAPAAADSLGRTLAERLLDQGGREILAQIYGRPL